MKITKKIVVEFLNKLNFRFIYKEYDCDRYQLELKDIDDRFVTLLSDILNCKVGFITFDVYSNCLKIMSDGRSTKWIYYHEISIDKKYKGLKLFLTHFNNTWI